MRSSRRFTAAAVACATATVGLVPTFPAQAAVLESGTEDISFTETVNKFCDVNGLRVLVEGDGTLTYRLETKGDDGEVFYAERVDVDVRLTNVRTGSYVISHERSSFRDVTITDNGDGTHTIIYFGTGNAYISDSSGTVIGRNPGQLRFEVVIDLNGTPEDFEDDEVISEEVILGSTGRNDDFCTAVVAALT